VYAWKLSPTHSLKVRLALCLALAGAVVALAIVVLVVSRSDPGAGAMAPGRAGQLQREILMMGLLAAAGFGILGWFLAGRIAGPLLGIAEAARRIEQGDRDVLIPSGDGSDELATLARSLNSLVGSLTTRERELQRLASSLEQRVVERTAELSQANTMLEELSTTDGLTKVANRRHFDTVLDREWRLAARYDLPLGVIMIDIDHFKGYNDTYGHQQGDECLRRVAAALSKSVTRAGDLVARYGGEEFAVILSHMAEDEAIAVADRLRAAVEELRIPHRASSASDHVTISLGVAAMVPERDDQASALLALADRALYTAKEGGRNRVSVAHAMGARSEAIDETGLPAAPLSGELSA
jgi:diguanylate cyclase (GGDEF)-like protein